jgi:hypothetical protein
MTAAGGRETHVSLSSFRRGACANLEPKTGEHLESQAVAYSALCTPPFFTRGRNMVNPQGFNQCAKTEQPKTTRLRHTPEYLASQMLSGTRNRQYSPRPVSYDTALGHKAGCTAPRHLEGSPKGVKWRGATALALCLATPFLCGAGGFLYFWTQSQITGMAALTLALCSTAFAAMFCVLALEKQVQA